MFLLGSVPNDSRRDEKVRYYEEGMWRNALTQRAFRCVNDHNREAQLGHALNTEAWTPPYS